MNNKENFLIVSHEDLYGKEINESSEDTNNNENFVDMFSYDNIVQEYDFNTGATALYLKISENHYEILYENIDTDNISNVFFYSKEDTFITTYNSDTSSIVAVDYMPTSDFVTYFNKFSYEPKFTCISKLKDYSSKAFMQKYSDRLIQNNISYTDEDTNMLLDKYKRIFIKYTVAAQLIPVSNILEACISNIHQFIANNRLDCSDLEKSISQLEYFKKICPNSISALSSFLDNPNNIDLRNLCATLETNLQNVDNLINMYLEDELKIQTNERND